MRRPADRENPRPPGLAFRRVRPEDLPRLVEIEKEGFRHPWSRELLERELHHAWSTILLAVLDRGQGEELCGFIVFWLVHDEVHILNVVTAVAARRRGVGRALMEEAQDTGRRRGAVLPTLEVRRSNEAALALYRSLGYRQTGVRLNYYSEEGEDAIVMLADL